MTREKTFSGASKTKRPSAFGKKIPVLYLLLAALIWGFAFVAQVAGMDYVESFTYTGVRFFLGALSLIPVIRIFEKDADEPRKKIKTALYGTLCGVVLFTAVNFQQFGIVFTNSAGKSGFITGLYIVIVPIMGIFLGKKTNIYIWLGAALAVVGLYLLSCPNGIGSITIGDAVLLIGAFFWAIHILIIDRFIGESYVIRFSMWQFLVCASLSAGAAFIFETPRIENILAGYVPILYGGIFSAGLAYTFQTLGQREVPAAKAAIVFSLESLFSAVGGAILLGELMTAKSYVGCGFIFAGIILSQFPLKSKQ
jgi:drug/metabolite transporter (DMT)-like permease